MNRSSPQFERGHFQADVTVMCKYLDELSCLKTQVVVRVVPLQRHKHLKMSYVFISSSCLTKGMGK